MTTDANAPDSDRSEQSDITTRLRWDMRYTRGHVSVTMDDAAKEIEKLRIELAALREKVGALEAALDASEQKEQPAARTEIAPLCGTDDMVKELLTREAARTEPQNAGGQADTGERPADSSKQSDLPVPPAPDARTELPELTRQLNLVRNPTIYTHYGQGGEPDQSLGKHSFDALLEVADALRARCVELQAERDRLRSEVATEYVRGREHEQSARRVADGSFKGRADEAEACCKELENERDGWKSRADYLHGNLNTAARKLAEVREELAHTRTQFQSAERDRLTACAELSQARAERERDAKDAARYQSVRASKGHSDNSGAPFIAVRSANGIAALTFDHADYAVDAAIALSGADADSGGKA